MVYVDHDGQVYGNCESIFDMDLEELPFESMIQAALSFNCMTTGALALPHKAPEGWNFSNMK